MTRLDRLLQSADRDRFATARAILKSLVSDLAAVSPTAVRLTYYCRLCDEPHGRPRVDLPHIAGHFDVSISHSGQRVLVAASRVGSIGVDVEALSPHRDDLVESVQATLDDSELVVIDRLPPDEREAAVLRYWVRKEAMLKCSGVGLQGSPSRIRLGHPYDKPILLDWNAPEALSGIWLRDIDLGSGYYAVLASDAPIESELDVEKWSE